MTVFPDTRLEPLDPPFRAADCIHDLWAGELIPPARFAAIRRHLLLEGCKSDPQVGDAETLSPFPLVMKSSVWKQIAFQSEQLTAEAHAAEEEVLRRPELLNHLGLPRALRKVLAQDAPLTPEAGRVMRLNFHYTKQGWRISSREVGCVEERLIIDVYPNDDDEDKGHLLDPDFWYCFAPGRIREHDERGATECLHPAAGQSGAAGYYGCHAARLLSK
jgi:hypothetical protein